MTGTPIMSPNVTSMKRCFHGGADLQGLLRVLVAEHAVQELSKRLGSASALSHDGPSRRGASVIVPTGRGNRRCRLFRPRRFVLIGALTVLVAIVMVWFAAGSGWNVRKGKATMRWMQDGLPQVGERTTVKWLGTNSVEMVIQKAKSPFEQVTLVIFLEPRDVPWIWALTRARGRRDTLIIRARLPRAPRQDLEVLDRASWSGRDALRRMASEEWSVREPADQDHLTAFSRSANAAAQGDTLLGILRGTGITVRRLSVRSAEPHLQLHMDLTADSAPRLGALQDAPSDRPARAILLGGRRSGLRRCGLLAVLPVGLVARPNR